MIITRLQTLFTKCVLLHQNPYLFRYIRSIARRETGPKLLEGKVKTITDYDDSPQFETYKDLIKNIKQTKLGDELEVEKHFLNEDYYGDAFEKCEMYYDMHVSEEKQLKSQVKKKIIGRKYFKLDKETNLLTHAAKEQIRFLHKSNPVEWNCKTLSDCFPISEEGVKKLLRSNFVQTCPEKIKLHDEDVARKWEILKSGRFTDKITPLTQKLYKEGKLIDDYFSGHPDLPTVPPSDKKVIEIKEKGKLGEFSSIVQTYFDYEEQKLFKSGKEENSSEKQVTVIDNNIINPSKNKIINLKKFKYAAEEIDDDNANPEIYPSERRKYTDNGEIPFSQFKETLTEKTSLKLRSKYKNEYDDFVMQEMSKSDEIASTKKPQYSQNCFLKIPKYEKKNVNLMYEKNKNANSIYKYDEKFGYQHPVGKNIKGKINVSFNQRKKGKLYKVGQSVYDDDGEFLYEIP